MSIYAVAQHHLVHTCPADPQQPHSIDIRRRIVHITPGRDCQHPVTIRVGQTTATIPCGRHEPHHRRCDACRTIITIVQVTVTDLGHLTRSGQYQPAPTLYDGQAA